MLLFNLYLIFMLASWANEGDRYAKMKKTEAKMEAKGQSTLKQVKQNTKKRFLPLPNHTLPQQSHNQFYIIAVELIVYISTEHYHTK